MPSGQSDVSKFQKLKDMGKKAILIILDGWGIGNHGKGDVIILCGKGHEDYQIIGKTKIHMDEREIVAEILEKRKQK